MKEICVVHLVRAQNGIEPFARFLKSYQQNPGGMDHDLLIVFKGFDAQASKDDYLHLLAPVRHRAFEMPDIGFDITAYFAAAKEYAGQYRYFCFLNSFSVIQDSEWINKLYQQISLPEVGLVGATGSWQSHRGSIKKSWLIPIVVGLQHYRFYKDKTLLKRLIFGVIGSWKYSGFLWDCEPFPNYHVRTNAFMISGDTINKIKCKELKSKSDAHLFESGKSGLTSQIIKMGKLIIVVGKDGVGYGMERWNESNTFWHSEQENLLVADNQTRDYQSANSDRRKYLSYVAWGNG